MTRDTRREVYNDHGSFVETTTGDAPSSAEVSFNARGVAQLTVKCYYPDAKTMAAEAAIDVEEAILNITSILQRHGIQVAGMGGKGATE